MLLLLLACQQPTPVPSRERRDVEDVDGDGYRTEDGDCDDDVASVYPGAAETCDGSDEDCDGEVDEDFEETPHYQDGDGDGYGDARTSRYDCAALPGEVADGHDCNDADANVHPGALEVCDGDDEDCDTYVDEADLGRPTRYADTDGDGYGDPDTSEIDCEGTVEDATDCDDGDAAIHPDATEWCDDTDDDCDGVLPADEADPDGDGQSLCEGDCDDAAPFTWSGALERCDNGVDDDCDGVTDADCPVCDAYVWSDAESIGDAIAAATDGDLICVAGGTYVETVDFQGKEVEVRGRGPRWSEIAAGSRGALFVTGEGPGAVLAGFTVRDGWAPWDNLAGGGIVIVDSSPTLEDLVVTDCHAFGAAGMWVSGGAPYITSVEVLDNVIFYGDPIGSQGGGIRFEDSDAIVDGARIEGNDAYEGGGAYIDGGTVAFFGVDLVGNEGAIGGGAYVAHATSTFENVRFRDNTVSSRYSGYADQTGLAGSAGGLYGYQSDILLTNVAFVDNTASAAAGRPRSRHDRRGRGRVAGAVGARGRRRHRGDGLRRRGRRRLTRARVLTNERGPSCVAAPEAP